MNPNKQNTTPANESNDIRKKMHETSSQVANKQEKETANNKQQQPKIAGEKEGKKKPLNAKKVVLTAVGAVVLLSVGAIGIKSCTTKDTPPPAIPVEQANQEYETDVNGNVLVDANGHPIPKNQAPTLNNVGPDYNTGQRILLSTQPDHWARQPDPIRTYINNYIDKYIKSSQFFDANSASLNINGTKVGFEDPLVINLKNTVWREVDPILSEKYQIYTDSSNNTLILQRSSLNDIQQGKAQFDTIKNIDDYALVENDMINALNTSLSTAMLDLVTKAQSATKPVDPQSQGISEQQREEYRNIIDKYRNEVQQLRDENVRLRQEAVDLKLQFTKLAQQIEDNPRANKNLQAKMVASAYGFRLEAVQGDLIFLRNKYGEIHTYRLGDPITDKLFISGVEENTGLVYLSPRK